MKSFPEHVDVLAFMNAIESLYGAKLFELACIDYILCAPVRGSLALALAASRASLDSYMPLLLTAVFLCKVFQGLV